MIHDIVDSSLTEDISDLCPIQLVTIGSEIQIDVISIVKLILVDEGCLRRWGLIQSSLLGICCKYFSL